MKRLPLKAIGSIMLLVVVFAIVESFVATHTAHAGGTEETLSPFEEKKSEDIKPRAMFFLLGFITAVFLMAL